MEMYARPRVNVQVERGSTFMFTHDLPYIAYISFARKTITCVRRKNYAAVEIHQNSIGLFTVYSQGSDFFG